MKYVISDVHGCYREFLQLLEKIHFSEEDELFLLGDMVDRGPEPIPLLQDVMLRPNVYPILGNHDYAALTVLRKLNVEITADNADSHLTSEDMLNWVHWMQDGGGTTSEQFSRLTAEEKADVLDYLSDCALYEEASAGGRRYTLVHAGIHHFDPKKPLDAYHLADFLFYRADYDRRHFASPNHFLVTGHTPTMRLRPDRQPEIWQQNGHIAIDCGCVFGGRLAAFCLDTQEAFYVDAQQA